MTPVAARPLALPAWRGARLWVLVAVLLLLGAFAATRLGTGGSGAALDPGSPAHGGAKALATLLRSHGVAVSTSHSLRDVHGSVIVTEPAAYSTAQLHDLASRSGSAVLLGASAEQARAAGAPVEGAFAISGRLPARCSWPGSAAGPVQLPAGTLGYATTGACYGGAAVPLRGGIALLGSPDLLRNDHVADDGVAALDVNLITDNLRLRSVTFLLPGAAATGQAAPTTWALFPDGARRAFVWLVVVGLVLVLWRARRLGPVVSEPLPVLVRSAEVIEGHGRLYRRAAAHDRAAAALRGASRYRLRIHLGLPRRAAPADVTAAAAARAGRDPATVAALLDGPPPADDTALLRLATDLDELEAAAGVPPPTKGS